MYLHNVYPILFFGSNRYLHIVKMQVYTLIFLFVVYDYRTTQDCIKQLGVNKEKRKHHQTRIKRTKIVTSIESLVVSITLHPNVCLVLPHQKMNRIIKTMMTSSFFTISSFLFFIIFHMIGKSFSLFLII